MVLLWRKAMGMKQNQLVLEIITPVSERDASEELEAKMKKYFRGDGTDLESLKDKKLKGQLSVREQLYSRSAKAAAKADKWLMPTEDGYLEAYGLEKTWRMKQNSVLEVDIASSRKAFDIVLPDLGPYTIDYMSSGRLWLLLGEKVI